MFHPHPRPPPSRGREDFYLLRFHPQYIAGTVSNETESLQKEESFHSNFLYGGQLRVMAPDRNGR